MTPAELLTRAQSAGLTLWREGDRLKYRGPTEAITALLPELRAHKAELLDALNVDPAAEARRHRALALLASHPEARIAVLTDVVSDPKAALLTVAIRGVATCELRIPREKYDGVLLLDLIERHGATIH